MILVVGATGQLGGMITRRLLASGHLMRILVRSGPNAGALIDAGAQPVLGDLKHPASLEEACEGVDTVITTANSVMRGGLDNVRTVDDQGNRNLIDAARAASVRHFIFISALGADVSHPIPFLRAKARTEAYLRESGMEYTILAPNTILDSWAARVISMPIKAGQPVTLIGEARRRHALVSAEDVAAFAVAAIGNPAAMNRYFPIGGPEAVTWRDVVASFQRQLGREIPVRYVSPGTPVPGLPDIARQILAGLELYESRLDMSQISSKFGVRLTTLDECVRRQLASA